MTMNTGKLAQRNDPRMPDLAPENAPDITEKPMPELPLDGDELKYPPNDQLTGMDTTPVQMTKSKTTEEALSEVPRKEPPLDPAKVEKAVNALHECIALCEPQQPAGPGEGHEVVGLCLAACRTALHFLQAYEQRELVPLVQECMVLTARTNEWCATVLERHPSTEAHAVVHRAVSVACRELAHG